MLGEHLGAAGGAHLVPGPAHPLQPPGDGAGGLDQDHQVDGFHVDAEFESRGRHHAAQRPGLQAVLDDEALLA